MPLPYREYYYYVDMALFPFFQNDLTGLTIHSAMYVTILCHPLALLRHEQQLFMAAKSLKPFTEDSRDGIGGPQVHHAALVPGHLVGPLNGRPQPASQTDLCDARLLQARVV